MLQRQSLLLRRHWATWAALPLVWAFAALFGIIALQGHISSRDRWKQVVHCYFVICAFLAAVAAAKPSYLQKFLATIIPWLYTGPRWLWVTVLTCMSVCSFVCVVVHVRVGVGVGGRQVGQRRLSVTWTAGLLSVGSAAGPANDSSILCSGVLCGGAAIPPDLWIRSHLVGARAQACSGHAECCCCTKCNRSFLVAN